MGTPPAAPNSARDLLFSMQAHEATKKGDEKAVAKVEAEVDLESAKLWNLSAADLAEILRSLKELTE